MRFLDVLKSKFSQEKVSAGLDIGTQAIKLAVLRFSKTGIDLCDFYLEQNAGDLSVALNKIIELKKIQKANISVSGPASIIRYVNFPRMSEDELSKSLRFEAAKHIPFSLEEVSLDSCILKESLQDNKMLVMLAAVKKEFLRERLKLMQESSLKVGMVDIDSLALTNAFNFNYSQGESVKNKAVALLNIGASFANLTILEQSLPRLSRDIQIKANDEASALSEEVRSSFDYYESQGAANISRVFLSGGGSISVALKETLAGLLGIETECWDPLKRISIAGNINSGNLKAVSGQLAVAVGLALRH